MNNMEQDYEKYCNEKLPDEFLRLRENGRTGIEAFISRDNYQKRMLVKGSPNAPLSFGKE